MCDAGPFSCKCYSGCSFKPSGKRKGKRSEITFYGSSFITDLTGDKIIEADKQKETHISARIDLEALRVSVRDGVYFVIDAPIYMGL